MDECYIDQTEKSPNHFKTLKYITKVLSRTNDDINTITIETFADRIRNYKTSNGTILSYGSIKCLFYTMQRERSDWDFATMKLVKNTFWNQEKPASNLYNTEITNKIINMIMYFIEGLFNGTLNNTKHQVARAILITLATNLRMAEILQLKKRHLRQLINNEIITIHIKKKVKGVRVLVHNWLLKPLLDMISKDTDDDDCKIVNVTRSVINKMIKENTVGIEDVNVKLGIQSIRKINTTLIIEHGDITLAQEFNRHTRSEVTQQYYNNKTYIGPTINKLMKQNHSVS